MHISDEDRLKIEAIKLSVVSTAYVGFCINEVFEETVKRLTQYYMETEDKRYLEVALLHIHAYVEMGFSYEQKNKLFDYVLKHLGKKKLIEFPQSSCKGNQVKLNKTQVKNLISRWPASRQRPSLDEVVEDIIYKVKNKEVGVYYYDSNPTPGKEGTSGDLYQLFIGEKDIVFHDIKRRRYFTFL